MRIWAFRPRCHEGRDVGRLLLEKAERHLFAKLDKIWLETEICSRAYAFYKRAGWLPIEKQDRGLMKFVKARFVENEL
ncbi:GNAT family N-acetyltransferase [Salinicola sp. CPA57]|uniref:GNAT family N-acetyltransferase n=1 Tax=Salinicola sp. CPA57 TaxID=1949080 RepID=UPI000DA20B7A|nr:GNAT family N-acetyltransferase [Salinicola sp. CPA57]